MYLHVTILNVPCQVLLPRTIVSGPLCATDLSFVLSESQLAEKVLEAERIPAGNAKWTAHNYRMQGVIPIIEDRHARYWVL